MLRASMGFFFCLDLLAFAAFFRAPCRLSSNNLCQHCQFIHLAGWWRGKTSSLPFARTLRSFRNGAFYRKVVELLCQPWKMQRFGIPLQVVVLSLRKCAIAGAGARHHEIFSPNATSRSKEQQLIRFGSLLYYRVWSTKAGTIRFQVFLSFRGRGFGWFTGSGLADLSRLLGLRV